MSNAADLKAALIAEAAAIDDAVEKLECLSDIDSWYTARTALDALRATQVSGYGIAGRNVTRRDPTQTEESERRLYVRVMERLRSRGAGLVDLRVDEGTVTA